MKDSKTKISLSIMVIAALAVLLMFTFASGRSAGGNEWGHGDTREEACANAKARVRMQCEDPVMSDCECNTFDPRSKWTCNVNYKCR